MATGSPSSIGPCPACGDSMMPQGCMSCRGRLMLDECESEQEDDSCDEMPPRPGLEAEGRAGSFNTKVRKMRQMTDAVVVAGDESFCRSASASSQSSFPYACVVRSPSNQSCVSFGKQHDYDCLEGTLSSYSQEVKQTWPKGTRVITRCALAGVDKAEVETNAVGRVWDVDERGVVTVFVDFDEDSMRGHIVRAEVDDLTNDGFLGVGTKVICLAINLNQNGQTVHVPRGATGMITSVTTQRAKYGVRFDHGALKGFECNVPMHLVQPRAPRKSRVRQYSEKLAEKLKPKFLARSFGSMRGFGTAAAGDDCGSPTLSQSPSGSLRSALKDRSRVGSDLGSRNNSMSPVRQDSMSPVRQDSMSAVRQDSQSNLHRFSDPLDSPSVPTTPTVKDADLSTASLSAIPKASSIITLPTPPQSTPQSPPPFASSPRAGNRTPLVKACSDLYQKTVQRATSKGPAEMPAPLAQMHHDPLTTPLAHDAPHPALVESGQA
eukprot:TRINITY_DN1049_c0_g1_i1.p1 TRINITY_DN1049_c0_g1~~TRINITY_DN1049_c0_g1_i1.p1  ORF type:complete len:492 (+),score=124.41 TRINITY_DN1049_c0_g1_i1:76-1551(+)